MNGDCRSVTDQILAAIDYGKLSREETERRLVALIDAEAARQDGPADMARVNACEDLLMAMHTHGTMNFESNLLANQAAVHERCRAWNRRREALGRRGHVLAAVAAAIVVLVGVCGGVRWRWLAGTSTPDGQQYVIQQREIGIETIRRAIAEHTDMTEITTDDRDRFVSFLGFDPDVPDVIQGKWEANEFYAMFFPDVVQIGIRYAAKEEKKSLVYAMYYYTSLENAYSTFEQDAEGEYIKLRGVNIYETTNEGRTSLTWIKNTTVTHIAGNITLDEGRCIADKLLGGDAI